jgi:hypothetical protein
MYNILFYVFWKISFVLTTVHLAVCDLENAMDKGKEAPEKDYSSTQGFDLEVAP